MSVLIHMEGAIGSVMNVHLNSIKTNEVNNVIIESRAYSMP